MQTPYQQLAIPQAVGVAYPVAVSAPAQPSDSANACCPCCVEPACCSRVGACPCFCSGYTAAFSVALASIWMALPMLATAMGLTDLFEISVYGIDTYFLGMWQACGYSYSYYYECDTYSSNDLVLLSSSTSAQFNAMRSLAVVATAFTLLTGILGAIRLARLQRAKPNSSTLNNFTLISALLALASAGTSFGLTFPLVNTLTAELGVGQWGMGTSWGVSWVMLVVGVGLLVVGVSMHLIAHCCYQYNVVNGGSGSDSGDDDGVNSEQPGMGYAVNGYSGSSIFAHPQPLQHAVVPVPAVYYPTAAAVHYPQPHYVQAPPQGHIYHQ